MDLHALVRGAITTVNPDVVGSILPNAGTYTTEADGTQVPAYLDPVTPVPMQVQPLSSRDLRQLESLNITDVDYAVYVNGPVTGVDRATGQGGDLLTFGGKVWLATAILEAWNLTAGWTKVAATEQLDTPA